MFTLPQDYSHVSFQRPLMTNESHLAKQRPITMRLNPSLVQQSSHHFVDLQKQYKTYFPLTMTSAEKVFSSPSLSHLFLGDIYIFQTNMNITLAPTPHLNIDRESAWHKWEWSEILFMFGTGHHESLPLVSYTVLPLPAVHTPTWGVPQTSVG